MEICCGAHAAAADSDTCGKPYSFARLKRRARGISGGIFNHEDRSVGRLGISHGHSGAQQPRLSQPKLIPVDVTPVVLQLAKLFCSR